MKKTTLQIANFLSQCSFKSEQEWKRIVGICASDAGFQLKSTYAISPDTGITTIDFLDWCDNEFGAGDICELDGVLVICGICHFKTAIVAGKLFDDKIHACEEKVAQNALKYASEDDRRCFMSQMLSQGLQFSLKEMKLVKKYVPKPADRVIFTSADKTGIGVVRGVNFESDTVDFFCYHINETGETGYSMHELGITSLSEMVFEPMNNDLSQRQTKGNGIYLQRKLNKILGGFGKVWNEKLHRIEPLNPMVEVGEKYWYINDKLELVQDIERGKITSRRRYFVANYFKTHMEGLEYLGAIAELLRDRYGLPEKDNTEN